MGDDKMSKSIVGNVSRFSKYLVFFVLLVSISTSGFAILGGENNFDIGQAGYSAIGAGAGLASSMLMSQLSGANDLPGEAAGITQTFTQTLGAVGSFGGSFLGPMGGMGFGALGSLVGGLVGAGVADATGKDKKIDRPIILNPIYTNIAEDMVTMIEKSVRVSDRPGIYLERDEWVDENAGYGINYALYNAKFKLGGDELPADGNNSISMTELVKNTYTKVEKGRNLQVVPVKFARKGSPAQVENRILHLDYGKLDLNKLLGLELIEQTLKWKDAGVQSKVDAKDRQMMDLYEAKAPTLMAQEREFFALLFRNVADEEITSKIPNINCFGPGGRQGSTGPEAKPKVLFDWEWPVSTPKDYRECSSVGDGDFVDFSYCDSTQFTMEILSRLYLGKESDSWVLTPGEGGIQVSFTNSVNRIASILTTARIENNEFVEIQFTNNEDFEIYGFKAHVKIVSTELEDTIFAEETLEFNTISNGLEAGSSITFEGDALGDLANILGDLSYRVVVSFSNFKLTDTILAGEPENNIIPFSDTSNRLSDYEITEYTTNTLLNKEFPLDGYPENEIYDVLHFRAYLMADGYTNDFLEDFEDYSQNQFLGFDPVTKNMAYTMINEEKIHFLPKEGELLNPLGYTLQYPGIYNVDIVVHYKDLEGFMLFDTNGAVKDNIEDIKVYLNLADRVEKPYYRMPLNATVGVENNEVKREGYGVSFEGDNIWFVKGLDDILIAPTLVAKSTPLSHITMSIKQDFQTLKNGMLLEMKQGGVIGNTIQRTLNLYPSEPHPIAMKIKKKSEGPAYGFFTLHHSGGPVNTGENAIYWSLYCPGITYDNANPSVMRDWGIDNFTDYDCESFNGTLPIDEMFVSDMSGVRAKEAPTGQLAPYSYGLEWPSKSIIRDASHSDVFYRGILYTPPSIEELFVDNIIASDESEVKTFPATFNMDSLTTIAEIYDLVDQNAVCVSEAGQHAEFWWNPAAVFKGINNID
jgi:hypothetical protein